MPLPPDVANKTISLPEKSHASRNEFTMCGATYHQMGNPTKTVSYDSTSAGNSAIAGRDRGSFISIELRLLSFVQSRSAAE